MKTTQPIVFLADMFIDECVGGAELTSDAIIKSSPFEIIEIRSQDLNIELAEKHSDKFWLIGNFFELDNPTKLFILKNINYSLIEFDYKYCKRRNDDLCIILDGTCNCHINPNTNLNANILIHSRYLWWMSKMQQKVYHNKIPNLATNRQAVLSSVFSHKTLNYISEIQNTKKNGEYLIYNTMAALKNTVGAIEFAKQKKIPYNLVGDIDYHDFLYQLSLHKGLIYVPLAKDTCPRLVIEAALLNCELYLNKYVQHSTEDWFQNGYIMKEYLAGRTKVFWDKIRELMISI